MNNFAALLLCSTTDTSHAANEGRLSAKKSSYSGKSGKGHQLLPQLITDTS